MITKFLGPSLALAIAAATAQENYSQWGFYKDVVVNTKATGANVAGPVTNYPLLVRFGAADSAIFNQAGSGGASLRFTKLNGTTPLKHQIDSWNATARSGAVWVLLDTIKGNDSSAAFRMYWRKNGAADSSSGPSVFTASNGFVSAWHLGDASGNRPNAVAGGNAAEPKNYTPRSWAGIIGAADSLRGGEGNNEDADSASLDYMDIGDGYATFANGATFSMWINPTEAQDNAAYFSLMRGPVGASSSRIYAGQANSINTVKFRFNLGVQTANQGLFPTADRNNFTYGQWSYLTFVRDTGSTGTMYTYINGVMDTSVTGLPRMLDSARTANFLGRSFVGTDNYYSGKLDEVRFANAPRTANWVKLDYQTQKSNANSVILGATQTGAAPVAASNLRYVQGNSAVNDTIVFQTGVTYNIVPTYTGGPVDSFKISGSLPAGITLNKFTGALAGVPTATSNAAVRTLTAYAAGDSTARVVVRSSIIGPTSGFRYSQAAVTSSVGSHIDAIGPLWLNRAPTAFSVVGTALPTGLSLNPVTGVISGVPSATSPTANYTVRATNATDTTTATVSITVNAAVSQADGNYSTAWIRHRTLTVNTAVSGANITGNVMNFPVLVRLGAGDSTVFSLAAPGGRDVRFTKANNTTRLQHEIEHWDAPNRSASIWVRLDTVYGNNAAQTFRMHWGNAAATAVSNGKAVFDSADGHLGVWHMGTATGAAQRTNAVAGGAPAVPAAIDSNLASGFVPVRGVIGMADTLRNRINSATVANEDHFNLGLGYRFPTGQASMSMWAKIEPFAGTEFVHFLTFGVGTTNNNLWFGRQGNTNVFASRSAHASGESGTASDQVADGLAPLSTWAHFAVVRSGTLGQTRTMYKNGAVVFGPTVGDATYAINDVVRTQNYIGRSLWGDRNMRGTVDEVRVARVAHDANWMKLSYENQKPGANMITSVNDVVGITSARLATADISVKPMGSGLLFSVLSPEAAPARLSILDMHGRTIWSHRTMVNSGRNQVTWQGTSGNGFATASGVYLVTAELLNAEGAVIKSLKRKIPLTR